MSTAARKARKKAGIPYAGHPVKVGTPLPDRASFEYMQPRKAAEDLLLRGVSKRKASNLITRLLKAQEARRYVRRAQGVLSRKKG